MPTNVILKWKKKSVHKNFIKATQLHSYEVQQKNYIHIQASAMSKKI